MELPEIDLEELKRQKERNFRQRLEFIEFYANWVKSKSNEEWSEQQKRLIG